MTECDNNMTKPDDEVGVFRKGKVNLKTFEYFTELGLIMLDASTPGVCEAERKKKR